MIKESSYIVYILIYSTLENKTFVDETLLMFSAGGSDLCSEVESLQSMQRILAKAKYKSFR